METEPCVNMPYRYFSTYGLGAFSYVPACSNSLKSVQIISCTSHKLLMYCTSLKYEFLELVKSIMSSLVIKQACVTKVICLVQWGQLRRQVKEFVASVSTTEYTGQRPNGWITVFTGPLKMQLQCHRSATVSSLVVRTVAKQSVVQVDSEWDIFSQVHHGNLERVVSCMILGVYLLYTGITKRV